MYTRTRALALNMQIWKCQANVRGLSRDKLRDIETAYANNNDIIALTETFLSPSKTSTCDFDLPGFHQIIRCNRASRPGGGVALYVSRALSVKRRCELESPDIEILWAEIRHSNNKFLLAVVYRPPNSTVSFWTKLQESFELASGTFLLGI